MPLLVLFWGEARSWSCLTCRSSRRRSAALRGAAERHAVMRLPTPRA